MNETLSLNLRNIADFVSLEEVTALAQQSVRHLDSLNNKTGAGNDFLGWMTLPDDILPQLDNIEKCAEYLRSISDFTVVIGIGAVSYTHLRIKA